MNEALLQALRDAVGEGNVLTSAGDLESYGRDWTRFVEPDPLAIVMARDVPQLQRLVSFAIANHCALVPSGGRTGLSAGAVAAQKEIVVAFDRMNRIGDFDAADGLVTVEPGVVTANLQQFAIEHGAFYPVDFASSGSSQIGGNISTNAGGIKVLRYGLTRERVAGLKVITGTGELLDLNRGLVKNATGYDFRHLFVGAEGTLGLIVEATISLVPPPGELAVMILAVPDMPRIMEVLKSFRQSVALTAFEFFSDPALDHVMAHHDMKAPLDEPSPYYALLEYELAADDDGEAAMAAFQQCLEAGDVTGGVVSQSEQDRLDLWKYREAISESITPRTPYKNDISVRVSKVPDLLRSVEALVAERYPEFEIVWFGHIGDGNLHLNVLKPEAWEIGDFKRECERVSEEVLTIVESFGGSISAEHGVGLLKRDQLHFTRSGAEIALMRGLKQVFDPHNIMNPGKLLPAETS